jgi:zinc and cadmium transporter
MIWNFLDYVKSADNMLFKIVIANIFISLLSLSGAVMILWKKFLTKSIIPYLVSFAAGVILTTAFMDLFPESLAQASELGLKINIFIPAFLGIVISFFIERFLLWFHHHEHTHGIKPTVLLITIGDGIHNLIDGVTIAATFLANPTLGLVTTIAIAAHEIPQEIADFSILIHSGLTKKNALIINLLSAFTAIIGGVLGFYFLHNFKSGLPVLLAFSAGIFIYISCSDLIPDLHRDYKEQRKWVQALPFIAGIILMYLLNLVLHG